MNPIYKTAAFLLAILLIVLLVLYVVTKNKNYLELVKKITRYTITAVLIAVVIAIFMRITHL
jgi:hypothetical protein